MGRIIVYTKKRLRRLLKGRRGAGSRGAGLIIRLVCLCLGVGACGDLKDGVVTPNTQPPATKRTYTTDIKPVLDANCVSCHGGATTEGSYDLSTIKGVVGTGSDEIPNALPGDAASLILQAVAEGNHGGASVAGSARDAIRAWVLVDSMGMAQPSVHPVGWMDAHSEGFHGTVIAGDDWDMSGCRTCHGADYAGTETAGSCLTCHSESPEDCATCHGSAESIAPPLDLDGNVTHSAQGVGAHVKHLSGGSLFTGMDCQDCHVLPGSLYDTGHLDSDGKAEVEITGVAQMEGHSPGYADGTCGGTYCHGDTTPQWTGGPSEAACGTCHGIPPQTALHPQVRSCDPCHGEVVDVQGNIRNPSLHVNGEINVDVGHPDGFVQPSSENFHGAALRRASWNLSDCQICHGQDYAGTTVAPTCLTCHSNTPEDCSVCHGGPDSFAPPRDINSQTATRFTGVGAHQAHLRDANVECEACHIVPERYSDLRHVDTALPAEVTFGSIALQGDASPRWDGETCANTYCHGNAQPNWTAVGQEEAACGTCHGLPPTEPHPQAEDCSRCHQRVVDETMRIIDAALHVNGTVEIGG
jgi:predicted CxxxxCH...CXXCH cytochrome family protein